jgi:hypothetical protein
MTKSFVVTLSFTIGITITAAAQTVRTPLAPAPVAAMQTDALKLQTAMMAAQAAAIKPGDEALPCPVLQTELVSTMNDPAILAYAERTNAAFAKEKKLTPEAAAALATSLVPGAAMAGMSPMALAAQPMTPQQMQQVMAAQQQATMAYMAQLTPLLPALMRSQRVMMLGAVKSCGWATGGLGLYPGATIPRADPPTARVPRN